MGLDCVSPPPFWKMGYPGCDIFFARVGGGQFWNLGVVGMRGTDPRLRAFRISTSTPCGWSPGSGSPGISTTPSSLIPQEPLYSQKPVHKNRVTQSFLIDNTSRKFGLFKNYIDFILHKCFIQRKFSHICC